MSGKVVFYEWEIMTYFYFLCKEYHIGRITLEELKMVLSKLFFIDEKADIWTLGIRSGKWYKRNKNKWIPGLPNGKLTQY